MQGSLRGSRAHSGGPGGDFGGLSEHGPASLGQQDPKAPLQGQAVPGEFIIGGETGGMSRAGGDPGRGHLLWGNGVRETPTAPQNPPPKNSPGSAPLSRPELPRMAPKPHRGHPNTADLPQTPPQTLPKPPKAPQNPPEAAPYPQGVNALPALVVVALQEHGGSGWTPDRKSPQNKEEGAGFAPETGEGADGRCSPGREGEVQAKAGVREERMGSEGVINTL